MTRQAVQTATQDKHGPPLAVFLQTSAIPFGRHVGQRRFPRGLAEADPAPCITYLAAVKQTASFRRDVKREAKGRYRGSLEEMLMPVLTSLASDISLEDQYCDHALTGNKKGFCDCRPGSHAALDL